MAASDRGSVDGFGELLGVHVLAEDDCGAPQSQRVARRKVDRGHHGHDAACVKLEAQASDSLGPLTLADDVEVLDLVEPHDPHQLLLQRALVRVLPDT
eukprot:1406137-Rhodomonas_salina.2